MFSSQSTSGTPPVAAEPKPETSSSNSSTLAVGTGPSGISGLVGELRTLIGAYMKGAKSLWGDWQEKQAIQAEKIPPKLFEGINGGTIRLLEPQERYSGTMTWRELVTVHKAKRNILKSLPVLTMFMIPILGNTVPLITYFFPHILPRSFLTDKQRLELSQKIRDQQREFSKQIVEDLKRMPELRDHPFFAPFVSAVEEVAGSSARVEGGVSIPNTTLNEYFEKGLELVLGFSYLSRNHLNALASCFPYAATRLHVYPSELYRHNLLQAAALLYEEDMVLIQDRALGLLEELSLQELQELCECRAIQVADFNDRSQLLEALNRWLDFAAQLDVLLISTHKPQQPSAFPASFYLHAALLKNLVPVVPR